MDKDKRFSCWMCNGLGGVTRDNTTDPHWPPTWRAARQELASVSEVLPCPACAMRSFVDKFVTLYSSEIESKPITRPIGSAPPMTSE